jgi:hypothetical protein
VSRGRPPLPKEFERLKRAAERMGMTVITRLALETLTMEAGRTEDAEAEADRLRAANDALLKTLLAQEREIDRLTMLLRTRREKARDLRGRFKRWLIG